MNSWHDFLLTQGASLKDGEIEHFGQPQAELQAASQQTVLADLSHLGLLELEGADTVTFLQGQVTNDVKKLNGSNSHYSGYCTPKGRLLALFLAFAHNDHVHLQFDRRLLEPIAKRLRMYVLRSKVTIKDVSDTIQRFGLAGPDAAALLQQHFAQIPQSAHELVSLENGAIIRLPDAGTPRYEIFVPAENAVELWSNLATTAKAVGKPVWDWLEIQAGIPEIVPATQEAFVPQMVNLDALEGINFKKGCYTGQEIVARTHYLGKVKRRTQLAHINSTEQPAAGAGLVNAEGAEAGQIVRSAASPNGGFDVLAEIRLESLEAGDVFWNQNKLEIGSLPYQLS